MPIGTGPAAAAMAILTAIRARNQSALEEARARREDQDFALRQAAQQAAQRNAAMQTEMQRTNNLINLSREQRAVQKENESSLNAARSQFLSDMDPYTKSRERGVPEAVAPMATEARKWVDYAPEYAKPGNPMHDTLDAQLKSDMEPMAAKAAEVAAQNQQNELTKKATGVKKSPGPSAPGEPPPIKAFEVPKKADTDLLENSATSIKRTEEIVAGAQALAAQGKYPGFIRTRINDLMAKVGQNDPDVSAWVAFANKHVSQEVVTLSGMAATDTERQFIRAQEPNPDDTFETLKTKARLLGYYRRYVIWQHLRTMKARYLRTDRLEKAYGVNPDQPFDRPMPWAKGPAERAVRPGTIPGAVRR